MSPEPAVWASLTSALGPDVLRLRQFEGEETLSIPFRYRIEMLSTRELKRDDLLTQPISIEASPNSPDEVRFIHGLVRSLRTRGRDARDWIYEVEIVPWLWFLGLNRRCRLFQKKTVKEIVQQVFDDEGFSDYRFSLNATYPTLDFTVQFGESDLAFVSRLLEANGIHYYFEHEAQKHTLVLCDAPGVLKPTPTGGPIVHRPDGGDFSGGGVRHVHLEERVSTGMVALDDYFYEKPTADLLRDAQGDGPGHHYHYPGGYVDGGEGARLAKVRIEAEEVGQTRLVGSGNAAGIQTGYRIQLEGSTSADGEYVVLSSRVRSGLIPDSSVGVVEETEQVLYHCDFEAIPFETPYRPPRRTPRPNLGIQTATVVGPKGEEIYTDKYGRVKVRFHWDSDSPEDGESSCWIRVASTWAGNKWGAFQIPRIGQEVVVEFLDGNPDRPLITGSVYNAQQMPPWDATPTQSGWKSHSSKKGTEESNELRFEDKKDEEEVFLRARKDLKVEVVNDETRTVDHDRTTTIVNDDMLTVEKGNRSVTVEKGNVDTTVEEGDLTTTVEKGKLTATVEGNLTTTVKTGNVETEIANGSMTTTLAKGNASLKLDLGQITYEAMKAIELKVGKNSIKIDQKGVTIEGLMVKIEAKTMAEFKGLTTKLEAKTMTEVKGTMVQVNGSAMLMAKGGMVMIG